VIVSNPLRTRAIAEAKIKTDKVDAQVLAQLLRCDYLPEVWQPDAATQELRQLTNYRASLVSDQTRIKNRIRSLLAQRLIEPPMAMLFSKPGLAWLKALSLNPADRLLVDGQLRLLQEMSLEVDGVEKALAQISYPNPSVRLLMTMPGIGPAVAQTVVAALGDWKRFDNGDRAASYLGLVPSTRQSAGHCYHGSITKAGASHARWLLTQAAQQLAVHPGPLGGFFRRIQRRKGHNVAVVATARKMVTVAWLMLQHNEPYRYSLPGPTQTKLASFRIEATGQRRAKGPLVEPRQPRPNGIRVRTTYPLNRVYQMEGLPETKTLDELALGEKRHVRSTGSEPLIRRIHKMERVTYRARSRRESTKSAPGETVAASAEAGNSEVPKNKSDRGNGVGETSSNLIPSSGSKII
jgi:transposase